MMERFRPSLEEGSPIQAQSSALDYIGKRGSAIEVSRRQRIQYARDILQKEVIIFSILLIVYHQFAHLLTFFRCCLMLEFKKITKQRKRFL